MLKVHQQFVEPETHMWRHPLGLPAIDAAFATYGIHFVPKPEQADVVLADGRFYASHETLASMPDIPHVLLDSVDQATAMDAWNGYMRTALNMPRVKAIVKSLFYGTVDTQNEKLFEGTRFGQEVYDTAKPWEQPVLPERRHFYDMPPLEQQHIDKLVSVCNPLWADCFQFVVQQLFNPERDLQPHRRTFDASFLGCGGWYGPWTVRFHRHSCVKAMRALSHDMVVVAAATVDQAQSRGRVPDWPDCREHYDMLMKSRICVSPWGFSEHSIRDYEAALAGCIMIKPYVSEMVTWPDVMNDDATIYCKPDFSDLDSIVRDVMDNWDHYEQLALTRARGLWELVRTPDAMVKRWSNILYDAAAKPKPERISLVSTQRPPTKYVRPMLSVGIVCWPCHPLRIGYLKQCLESIECNLRTPYDYELVLSLEATEGPGFFDAAAIAESCGATLLCHDARRGYGPHMAFLVSNMAGVVKLMLEDDHILPETLDVKPFLEMIEDDPAIGLIALGEANNGYVLDEAGTPAHLRHLVTLLSPESTWYFSNGIHLRTQRLAEEVGNYSSMRNVEAEWNFNEACKKAASEGRIKAYVSKVNYRATVGTYSTIVEGDRSVFNQPASDGPASPG